MTEISHSRLGRNVTLSRGCEGKTFSILARGNAQGPDEGTAHLLFAGEAGVCGNGFDAIGALLQAAPRCINANSFYGLGGCAATDLCINSREVPGTHVHSSCQRMDPQITFQVLQDPFLKPGEPI